MTHAAPLLFAMLLDAITGEPAWLWSRLPHPAVLLGRMVGLADRKLNSGAWRRAKGIAAVAILCAVAGATGMLISAIPDYGASEMLLAAILLAQRSLAQHVHDVASALRQSVGKGRKAVSRIVGRDTAAMDGSAIARSAIESAAENLSDGVIAPAFWFLILGLPGLLVYKAVNTADSMIGYLNDRYRDFGWAAARLDDVLNWIPARLTALLILLTRFRLPNLPLVKRDAPLHRSPNAGWPEAAMATVLNVALSGPRSYDGEMREFPFVYPEGRHALGPDDVDAAVGVLWRVWAGTLLIAAFIALLATGLAH